MKILNKSVISSDCVLCVNSSYNKIELCIDVKLLTYLLMLYGKRRKRG